MAFNNDDELRLEESSGGVFSALALAVLKCGGTVYGAAFNHDFVVEHIRIEGSADLPRVFGSKYSQSFLGDCMTMVKKDLSEGRPVLFSGTPCQIAGLKLLVGSENPNLFTIDFLCHGVPSTQLLAKYLKRFDQCRISNINMRSKKSVKGWENYGFSVEVNGQSCLRENRREPYMIVFSGDVCLNEACYSCCFRNRHCSDITLGDFWGASGFLSEKDKRYGVSRVLINTSHGHDLFARSSPKLTFRFLSSPFTYTYVVRPRRHKLKNKFIFLLENKGFKVAFWSVLPSLYWDKFMNRIKH